MSKGILIIACGHPFFGRMAHNLAASIKSVEPDMPIALRWAGDALNHLKNYNLDRVFDSVEVIPEHCYKSEGKNKWIRTKVFMYDLSPFDETIFLDADTIWIPKQKASKLFNDLASVEITFANYARHDFANLQKEKCKKCNGVGCKECDRTGKVDPAVWANLNHVKQAYNFETGYYYALQSEMIYFKKTDSNLTFFEVAKQVYDHPLVNVTVFAGFIPDEFAFSVAAAMCGIEPHQTPYYPTYWHPVHKRSDRETLFDRHYVLSVGGAFQSDYFKKLYDQLAAVAFRKLGLETPFKYINKRSWLPERKSI